MKTAKNFIKTVLTFDPLMQFLFRFSFDTGTLYFMRKVYFIDTCTINFLLSLVQHFLIINLLLISKYFVLFSSDENIVFYILQQITLSFLLNDLGPFPTPEVLFYCPISYPQIQLYLHTRCCLFCVFHILVLKIMQGFHV